LTFYTDFTFFGAMHKNPKQTPGAVIAFIVGISSIFPAFFPVKKQKTARSSFLAEGQAIRFCV